MTAKWILEIRVIMVCQENLKIFEPNGTKRLTDIVTGNERWYYFYNTPSKIFKLEDIK